jgi:death on curing protein
MPSATFGGTFLHPTLAEMAAAYLYHVSEAHAFVDGNKRAALAATLAFLSLNGQEIVAEPDDLYDVCLGVATGAASKSDAAVFIEKHLKPLA